MSSSSTEISKVQELVYELRVEQVMNRDVISISPNCSMRELEELLRIKRISGVPVVENGVMLGVISLEDLIRALGEGAGLAPVRERMINDVQVVRPDEPVVSAVQLFARYGYGRFPVVNARGDLVGILTKGDIIRGLLRQLEEQWQHEEEQRHHVSRLFEGIESDDTVLSLRYQVAAQDFTHGGEASSKIKRALEWLGADPRAVRRVAVATYEAEVNIMIHSLGGELSVEVRTDRLRLVASDVGPGIPDVQQALQPGYSTAPDWIREMGFGAGMGLTNIKSCANEMELTSEVGVGTRLEAVFKLR